MKNLGQKGFSLIEFGIGAAVMIGLSVIAVTFIKTHLENQQKSNTLAGMMQVRTELEKAFASEDTYKALLEDAKSGGAVNSASLSCLVNSNDCRAVGRQPIRMIDKNRKVMLVAANPANNSEGLTPGGVPCNEFNPIVGNRRCPYRYDVTWRPICPPAPEPCTKPSIEISAHLRFVPEADSSVSNRLDLEKYKITYVRREEHDKLSDTCLSVGGTILADGQCITNFGSPCPDGQFVVGFEANGLRICENIQTFQCPTGQVLTSIKSDGSYRCTPGCSSSGESGGRWFTL